MAANNTPSNSSGNNDTVLHYWTKSEADKVKHKLNGLSTTVEGLKIAVGVVGLGFTPFKFDASVLKGDEKGIVFLGRQLVTFPWAKDEAERQDKKLARLADRAERASDRAARLKEEAERLTARVRANTPADAQGRVAENPLVQSARRQAEQATKDAEKMLQKARRHYVKTLQTAQKTRHEEKDAEKSKEVAVKSLHTVRTSLKETRQQLAGLERQLAG
ncbi:hypothetical protein [Streptomyces sp. NPDC095602]|uniref:hypothetical protein n=1 Tax=unclassified Streptomyces TaxID=2593676 RepID=UPI00332D5992